MKNYKIEAEDRLFFKLKDLTIESGNKEFLQEYIKYIASVLSMFENLCKGKFQKALKKVELINLDSSNWFK